MLDFTLDLYELMLQSFRRSGYGLCTLESYLSKNHGKLLIVRHDVDKLPFNALQMGALEKQLNVKSSYYFRIAGKVYDVSTIKSICKFGHEVSYHYEDLSLCDGNYELAIRHFETNLAKFREICPAKTICMHGSPYSKYDNKKIWEKYDYRNYGVIAEPNFDIDFNEVFYLSDTGRSWNNSDASVRDKVNSKFDIKIKDTHDLIKKIENNELPDKIMINVHPQRWNDKFVPWFVELVSQNVKNVIKKRIIKFKNSGI